MDCSLPGSSVHEILHARVLEWVTIPFSRGSFQTRDRTQVSCIAGRLLTIWTLSWKPISFSLCPFTLKGVPFGHFVRWASMSFSSSHLKSLPRVTPAPGALLPAYYHLWWSVCTPPGTCLVYTPHPRNQRCRHCQSHRWRRAVESTSRSWSRTPGEAPSVQTPGACILCSALRQAGGLHALQWSPSTSYASLLRLSYTFRGSVFGTQGWNAI